MATNAPAFDVYLTGAKDKNPSVQMRLAANIAGRYRLSAPVVAEALDGVACRVAAQLPRREAQALVDALEALGAHARLLPAGAPAPSGTTPPRATDEFLSVHSRKDGRITLKSADVETPSVVDLAEPIDFAEVGPDGKTGVRGSDTVRCQIHGLVYNRRKASGCLRCLAAARAQARKLQEQTPGFSPAAGAVGSSLRENPVRRAFWGLAAALLVGFVPAAYYARAINRPEVTALRAQQAEISTPAAATPSGASPVVLSSLDERQARFDQLDAAVEGAHRRGAGRTLLIWLAVGTAAGLVWTRLTRPTGVPG